MLITLWKSSFM